MTPRELIIANIDTLEDNTQNIIAQCLLLKLALQGIFHCKTRNKMNGQTQSDSMLIREMHEIAREALGYSEDES